MLNVYLGDPSFIDPMLAFESEGIQVDQALYDSLTKFDFITSKIEPDVATSWDVNSDATVFTFHLKPGTKFHNGRVVTAADFKYEWVRLSDPANKSNYSYLLGMIKGYDDLQSGKSKDLAGVVATDDNTLTVTLAYPFADFPYVVAFPDAAPVPKEAVEKDPKAFADMPIGNGPFMMKEPWQHGQSITLVKFPDYAGTKPNIDGINFKIYSDIQTAFVDFKAGNLDWTAIPPGQYKATVAQYGLSDDGLTANPGKQVQNGQELGIYEILMNNKDPLFKNIYLREACSLAINRQAICDTVWEGVRKPASSIIPAGTVGYEADAWQFSHYDVTAAKAALAKAGYPNGAGLPTLKLSFNSGAGHENIMQLVQADLKAIGINTTFDTSDAPTYWDKVGKGNFQIGRSGWSADYPIIDDFLYPLFYSTSATNFDHYSNPAVDKAITDARQVADDTARLAAEQAVVKLVGNDVPEIPIATYAHERVTSSRVHNLIYSPMTYLDFQSCWISGS